MKSKMKSKYNIHNMWVPLKLFVKARRKSLNANLTDNAGSIHSVERILDIWSMRIVYPFTSTRQGYKKDKRAICSEKAYLAKKNNEPIHCEHVEPLRQYSRNICELIENNASKESIIKYVKEHFKLVLITKEEQKVLDKQNRVVIDDYRLEKAGIKIHNE